MVRLRSFQMRDLARLHQLDQICFPQAIAYSRAELKYFLTHPRCSCWIAEHPEDKVAGFLIFERTSYQAQPTGHIVTLDVDPEARRQGLGTLLMQCAEEQMKGEGASRMSLEVAEDNTAARHFYRRLGFVPRGRIAKYYGGRVDAEVMEKVISHV
jgi:[ribosomal protein S18]-alanine N-acetyltransferase